MLPTAPLPIVASTNPTSISFSVAKVVTVKTPNTEGLPIILTKSPNIKIAPVLFKTLSLDGSCKSAPAARYDIPYIPQ